MSGPDALAEALVDRMWVDALAALPDSLTVYGTDPDGLQWTLTRKAASDHQRTIKRADVCAAYGDDVVLWDAGVVA